ncbi:A/G-specific adenine glycosylase [Pyrobaculum sp.]|uniref:endonuclease III domain-containing protein n=1 Tax=Pyrobaculum sp. TaxID=2004705 RepID=UPI003168D928
MDPRSLAEIVAEWCEDNCDWGLPWRRSPTPWGILAAALLLRKTTAKQVAAVYEEFLKRYPEPRALLQAPEEELKALLRPLGIENQRARLFKELARELAERFGGQVPCDREALESLPGVGRYAASEVLLFACGEPEPLLDRNVVRLLERALGLKSSRKRPHEDSELWRKARELIPRGPAALKASLGLLDLARKVCTARKPKCNACPLRHMCLYATQRRGT